MHDDRARTELRAARALDSRLRPRVWAERQACAVAAFSCGTPVPAAEALAAPYTPVEPGTPWGAPWSTTWFRVTGQVPPQWAGKRVEAVVDLGFNDRGPGFQAEGLAYGTDGVPLKGIQPRNNWLPVQSPSPSPGDGPRRLDLFCGGGGHAGHYGCPGK